MAAEHVKNPSEQESLLRDLVMKGGITSGVGYPKLIHQLSQRYRFRSIWGASAGSDCCRGKRCRRVRWAA
jgi:hypothetical protein